MITYASQSASLSYKNLINVKIVMTLNQFLCNQNLKSLIKSLDTVNLT
jgi:hypothetical protein